MSQQGQMQQAVQHYRQQLLNNEASAERALNAAHLHTLAMIQPQLDKLYQEITAKINAKETIPPSWIYERLRLEHLTLLIKKQVDQFGTLSLQQTRMLQHQGAQLGQQSALAQLDATVPPGVKYSFGIPDPKAIADLVGATQAGSPLADLFGGFGDEAAQNVSNALVTGLSLGHNPRVVARDVSQALGISRARALTIARTEQIRAYRSANLQTFQANKDVVDVWIWSAALDRRTCAACIAMNGTEHPLSEQMGSHPNCRCVMQPKTKDWSAILGPLGIDTSTIPDSRPQIQSGADWFDDQDESTQRAILGNAKFAAFQNGDFDLEDIVGHTHDADWGHSIYEKTLKALV
jgi:SPP1 gp7 family putative phage head morphogenesis protein